MGDRITQPFEPYEPEQGYDWDYVEEGDERPPRVLWGRIAFYAFTLLLAFLLGRSTSPEGVPQEEVDRLRRVRAELEAEIEQLRSQPAATPTPEATATTDETTDPAAEVEGETYVVEPGDTLRGIAERFYDDPTLDDLIAEANDITDPTQLRVGQELIIPPKPD